MLLSVHTKHTYDIPSSKQELSLMRILINNIHIMRSILRSLPSPNKQDLKLLRKFNGLFFRYWLPGTDQ
ncbi:hypothetical protein AQUCO_02200022v1 [Aquilegia coerulea]|uniref:Uncharacterized protein n=1 Tax=Aquilegia coerulea TaxID=218851 RepID=A0A2G5DCY2_AQUCA|nr:hypothetical protein AQUCO_02200022v1 [Aquilegia coerulea]